MFTKQVYEVNTYKEIAKYIKEIFGKSVSPCCIAQVKRKYNLTTKDGDNNKKCSPDEVKRIEEALKHLGLIPQEEK